MVMTTDFAQFKDIGWPAAFLGAVIVIAVAAIIISYFRGLTK